MAFDGKYGEITSSVKDFHDGEPLFVLRAQDPLSVIAVEAYARICHKHGCRDEHVADVFTQAKRMQDWQMMNQGLVKALPGLVAE